MASGTRARVRRSRPPRAPLTGGGDRRRADDAEVAERASGGDRRRADVEVARRAKRASGDAKRSAILAAALVLFGRYGYRRTSIDDLAREAGVAKGTVYLYFDTKEAIFRGVCEAVIARVLADAESAAASPAPIGVRLRRILAAKFEYSHGLLHASPHADELLDSTNRVSADLLRRADRAYLRVVTRAIADAAARGELALRRRRLRPEAASDLLVASARGAGSEAGELAPPAMLRRRLDALVAVVVAALGGDATPGARRSA